MTNKRKRATTPREDLSKPSPWRLQYGRDMLTERHVGARHRIAVAIDAVGGVGCLGGPCLGHVVGFECSIREWATQQGWNGKPSVPARGHGILVEALGTLVLYYRLALRQRQQDRDDRRHAGARLPSWRRQRGRWAGAAAVGDRGPGRSGMSLYGAPRPPRSCLDRGTTPTDPWALDAMRRQVWLQHGVAALSIADITDPWLRQAITNEATRRWGPRNGGHGHGR